MDEMIAELLPADWEIEDGILICPDGNRVELDGQCPDGHVSPILTMGMI